MAARQPGARLLGDRGRGPVRLPRLASAQACRWGERGLGEVAPTGLAIGGDPGRSHVLCWRTVLARYCSVASAHPCAAAPYLDFPVLHL